MARRSKNKRPKGLQLTLGTCWPALLPTVVRLQTLRDRPRPGPAPRRQRQVPLPRFLEPRPRVLEHNYLLPVPERPRQAMNE